MIEQIAVIMCITLILLAVFILPIVLALLFCEIIFRILDKIR